MRPARLPQSAQCECAARLRILSAVAAIVLAFAAIPARSADDDAGTFDRQIAPILVRNCLGCHNAHDAKGNLVLVSLATVLKGGDSGPAIKPGKPDESLLVERVAAGEMPPEDKGESRRLPDEQIAALRGWIAGGAKWPTGRELDPYEMTTATRAGRDWWSLQPIRRPPVPKVKPAARAANPIDALVLARLEEHGLAMAPPADRRTLVRRLYFDLVGLPPAPEEMERLLADGAPDWYERLVDRLLASPHFGERWARYWLDLVRFAETSGYERDQTKPFAWKYRDWVVRAINQDKPYDRFVVEQLAGDELPDADKETLIATGLLRLGTWNDEPNDPAEYKYERLEDLVHTTSTALLGITVKCARCHDHKFDPVRQTDYYRMASVFWPGPIEPGDRGLLGGPSAQRLGYDDVLGWTDVALDPAPFHLLKSGDARRPLDVVEPASLSILPALEHRFAPPAAGAKTTQRRWQLAQWIVDPANPLPARVIVNRLWQHHFGKALVRTPNNFGFKGELPTHPELLDFLARELIDGGWKLKRIHKLMLLSQCYRQASLHPEEEACRQIDPGNRLWWRAERRRLDAEALRDAMLAVSGQLDLRMEGPSFTPTVSSEALEGLSRKDSAWQASQPDEQRRRSLYLFTKRSLLPPLMTAFDFCDTTQPCGERDVSIVAPQALALLNNPFAHECAAALAARLQDEAGGDAWAQVDWLWQLALGRKPDGHELAAALDHLHQQRNHFSVQSERMALESLCHVLLNANEFLFID